MVLQERVLVWDKTVEMNGGKVPAGKYWICKKSQVTKDAERRIAEAEALGQEDTVTEEDLANACNPVDEPSSDWCCLYQVFSLQDDFTNEKPMIQHYIEEQGHVCIFLPKFHCKFSDGKFTTAQKLVLQCLDMCDTLTIQRFFQKSWRYMDSYR